MNMKKIKDMTGKIIYFAKRMLLFAIVYFALECLTDLIFHNEEPLDWAKYTRSSIAYSITVVSLLEYLEKREGKNNQENKQ